MTGSPANGTESHLTLEGLGRPLSPPSCRSPIAFRAWTPVPWTPGQPLEGLSGLRPPDASAPSTPDGTPNGDSHAHTLASVMRCPRVRTYGRPEARLLQPKDGGSPSSEYSGPRGSGHWAVVGSTSRRVGLAAPSRPGARQPRPPGEEVGRLGGWLDTLVPGLAVAVWWMPPSRLSAAPASLDRSQSPRRMPARRPALTPGAQLMRRASGIAFGGALLLRQEVVRPQRTTVEDLTRFSPLPIYTTHGAFMKPWVVPHNRPPQARTHGNGGARCACLSRRIRRACGDDRACGGHRRRRSRGDDAGG